MPLDDKDELFILVDKDDKVLGTATRKECHSNKKLIHRGIYVVISDSKGRILLQKRSMKKDMGPGLWGISVGGHCSPGESYEDTAKREMGEELGIQLKMKEIGKLLVRDDDESEYNTIFSAVIGKENVTLDKDEIDEVSFFTKDEIIKLPENKVTKQLRDVMRFYLG